ncbi:MAG TPA: MBL fold metallo-hydrolase [Kofleriaceae bacterium]|nr:MBL fold metallo-hydrolase [Kofleriaceae bacterium]
MTRSSTDRSVVLAFSVLAMAACQRAPRPTTPHPPPPRPPTEPTPPTGELPPPTGEQPPTQAPPKITWKHVEHATDVPNAPPAEGTYRIHLIDVGTGLAILVQGHDFNLLYDGGTNDAGEKPLRVVSYLAAALGSSGDDLCVPKNSHLPKGRRTLDHVVLSHPHADHGSALDLVVHCYDVRNVWDSGRVNDAVFYRDFIEAVGKSLTATYHTAASVPEDHAMTVKGTSIRIERWQMFRESDVVELGAHAQFQILHAEGKKLPDPNQNSVVISVALGNARLLLVGDAESGERLDPSYPPGDVEEFLVEQHAVEIRSDILQVGHHGSKTSSRLAFLEAVKPHLALVSSGPKLYGKVRLPDVEVIDALKSVGATILRTDEHDENCPVTHRIGGDSGPGGCDSYMITIEPAK